MATDPVCGMEIDPRLAAARGSYADTSYVFCSPECKQQFDRAPAYYAQHPAPLRGQAVTIRGMDMLVRDDDSRTQGVDVVTAHPHTMTRWATAVERPRGDDQPRRRRLRARRAERRSGLAGTVPAGLLSRGSLSGQQQSGSPVELPAGARRSAAPRVVNRMLREHAVRRACDTADRPATPLSSVPRHPLYRRSSGVCGPQEKGGGSAPTLEGEQR